MSSLPNGSVPVWNLTYFLCPFPTLTNLLWRAGSGSIAAHLHYREKVLAAWNCRLLGDMLCKTLWWLYLVPLCWNNVRKLLCRVIFTHFCGLTGSAGPYHQHLDMLHFCTISLLGRERHFLMIVYSRKLNFPVLKPRDTIIISKTLTGLFFFSFPWSCDPLLVFCTHFLFTWIKRNSKVEGKLEVQTAEKFVNWSVSSKNSAETRPKSQRFIFNREKTLLMFIHAFFK